MRGIAAVPVVDRPPKYRVRCRFSRKPARHQALLPIAETGARRLPSWGYYRHSGPLRRSMAGAPRSLRLPFPMPAAHSPQKKSGRLVSPRRRVLCRPGAPRLISVANWPATAAEKTLSTNL